MHIEEFGKRDSRRYKQIGGNVDLMVNELSPNQIALSSSNQRLVTLGDLVGDTGLLIDGDWVESKDQDPSGDVRLIQLADVGDGQYLNKSARYLTSQKAKELRCTYLQAGDILIARMPDPLGRACVFPGEGMPCVTVVDVCILRPDPKIVDTGWLVQAINSPSIRASLNRFISGTTRQRISRKNLEKISLHLPSLDEQRRLSIVLEKASALRKKRQQSITEIDALLQSVFFNIFGDPVTNPNGWPTAKVESFCTIVRGSSPRPKGDPRYYGGTVPRLMVADLTRDGWLVIPRIDSLTEAGAKLSRPVEAGTVVMAVSGNVGLTAILQVDACVHDGFVAFKNLNTKVFNPTCLMMFLHFLKITHENRKAGAIFQNLTTNDIKSMLLPVPDLDTQEKFEQAFKAIYAAKSKFKTALTMTDDLFNAISRYAFNGEGTVANRLTEIKHLV